MSVDNQIGFLIFSVNFLRCSVILVNVLGSPVTMGSCLVHFALCWVSSIAHEGMSTLGTVDGVEGVRRMEIGQPLFIS